MGDLGGLYEALLILFKLMLIPITNFAYDQLILNNIFHTRHDRPWPGRRQKNSKQQSQDLVDEKDTKNHQLARKMTKDFSKTKTLRRTDPPGFLVCDYLLKLCNR